MALFVGSCLRRIHRLLIGVLRLMMELKAPAGWSPAPIRRRHSHSRNFGVNKLFTKALCQVQLQMVFAWS